MTTASKQSKLVLGSRKGRKRWFIKIGRRKIWTTFEAHHRALADVVRKAIDSVPRQPEESIALVPISKVIAWATPNMSSAQHNALLMMDAVCGDDPVGAFTKEHVDRLIGKNAFGSAATTRSYCWTLLWAIRMYADVHLLADAPRFQID